MERRRQNIFTSRNPLFSSQFFAFFEYFPFEKNVWKTEMVIGVEEKVREASSADVFFSTPQRHVIHCAIV